MRAVAAVVAFLVIVGGATAGYFDYQHHRTLVRDVTRMTHGGDPDRGRDAVLAYGCTACHDIPGFAGTNSHVGPPLAKLAWRAYLGGVVENRPDNLIRFLEKPRDAVPKGAMPNLNLSRADAQDLAAYLYTLQ